MGFSRSGQTRPSFSLLRDQEVGALSPLGPMLSVGGRKTRELRRECRADCFASTVSSTLLGKGGQESFCRWVCAKSVPEVGAAITTPPPVWQLPAQISIFPRGPKNVVHVTTPSLAGEVYGWQTAGLGKGDHVRRHINTIRGQRSTESRLRRSAEKLRPAASLPKKAAGPVARYRRANLWKPPDSWRAHSPEAELALRQVVWKQSSKAA